MISRLILLRTAINVARMHPCKIWSCSWRDPHLDSVCLPTMIFSLGKSVPFCHRASSALVTSNFLLGSSPWLQRRPLNTPLLPFYIYYFYVYLNIIMGISPSTEPTKHYFSHSKLVCVIILRGHPLFKISYYLKFAFSIIYTINKQIARHNVNSWQEQLKKFPSIP